MTEEPPEVVSESQDAPASPAALPTSLRRELLAILFLYGALSVLPFLIGWAMGR